MRKIIALLGPTAVGKSDIAVECAQKLNGEIISADSIQVYRGLDIGSGKITKKEMRGIVHHLIDIKEPTEDFNAFEYKQLVYTKIDEILAKNKTPIIVGGTGLYVRAIIENYDFKNTEKNDDIRNKYENLISQNGVEYVYNLLKNRDPKLAVNIEPHNKNRIIRALEICENKKNVTVLSGNNYEFLTFALFMERQLLYDKINKRVDKMFEEGLELEVKNLYKSGIDENYQCMQAIGYKEFFPYFKGESKLEDTKNLIKQKSRNYAKRQLTWLRSMNNIIWVDVNNGDPVEKIINYYK